MKRFIKSVLHTFLRKNRIGRLLYHALRHNSIKCSRGNTLVLSDASMRNCSITITGKNNILIFGEACSLSGMSILMTGNDNRISLGRHVLIHASKNQPTIINAVGGSQIIIGDHCLLSNNIEIHSSDYHKIINYEGIVINNPRNIHIGNHVWVGLGCTILKGSKIGDDSIVGTQSLVNKVFEETNCIIAGNPAVIVKQKINWDY